MNALIAQLKEMKLHGMAQTATELLAMKSMPSFTVCLQQLIDSEKIEREVRAIRYQMGIYRFLNQAAHYYFT